MELINNNSQEKDNVKYSPTIKDNSINWFNIEANKSVSNNKSIWYNSILSNKGNTGVYGAITPLTIASYASVNQQKQEPILIKMVQALNGEERAIMYIIGNRQLKAMQENGTIRNILLNPISVYNVKGLCGRRTNNLTKTIINTYTDAHGNTRYYWQDYAEKTNKGFKWSIKTLLNEFYIKVDDTLEDKYIYTPTAEFPQENNKTSVQRIIFTREYNNRWYLKNSFEIITPTNINDILNVSNTYEWLFNNNTGQSSQMIYMQGVCLGYDIKITFPNNDNICLLRANKQYMDMFTTEDYIGNYGIITEQDEEGNITKKISGTPLQNREIEIKKTDVFFAINVYSLMQIIHPNGNIDISTITPEHASYYNNIQGNTPFVNTTDIQQYLPTLDVLTILRLYQYMLNTDITIDERTLQTSIIPLPTLLKYYPIISYTQKFESFGTLKAKINNIKIQASDTEEEKQILDINLSNANVLDIEEESNIIELPNTDYFDMPTTHTTKSFTRCYEVTIEINYADFKNNLTYISFFGQKARVLSGQYSDENNTAKLIVLL